MTELETCMLSEIERLRALYGHRMEHATLLISPEDYQALALTGQMAYIRDNREIFGLPFIVVSGIAGFAVIDDVKGLALGLVRLL